MNTDQPTSTYIPDDSEVNTPSGGGSWRLSDGKIQRGRAEESNLESRDKVVGLLKRFAVQEGSGNENRKYAYFEAEFQTSRGIVRVHANLLDTAGTLKPSTAACSFAEGLLDMAPNELVTLVARQSWKANAHGSYSTIATLHHTSPDGKQLREVPRRQRPDGTTNIAMWQTLIKELMAHPAWKVREKTASESDRPDGTATTHLSALCKECAGKSWPTPEQNVAGWLRLMDAGFEADRKAKGVTAPSVKLSDYSDDDWGTVRQHLLSVQVCPEAIKMAEAAGAAPAPAQGSFNAGALG